MKRKPSQCAATRAPAPNNTPHLQFRAKQHDATSIDCNTAADRDSVRDFKKVTAASLHSRSKKGFMLRAFISRSPFKVPTDTTSPMIMIANGVGVASMRALLEHRKLEYDKLQGDRVPPRNLLFYGCTDSSSILFHEELQKLENEGFLTLKLALSAQDIDGKPPEYVHSIVALHLKEIVELTNSSSDARIFVSGMAAMARSIQHVFQSYTPDGEEKEEGGGMTKSWFDAIARSGRFVQDAF